jgi:hypothetical protein
MHNIKIWHEPVGTCCVRLQSVSHPQHKVQSLFWRVLCETAQQLLEFGGGWQQQLLVRIQLANQEVSLPSTLVAPNLDAVLSDDVCGACTRHTT